MDNLQYYIARQRLLVKANILNSFTYYHSEDSDIAKAAQYRHEHKYDAKYMDPKTGKTR